MKKLAIVVVALMACGLVVGCGSGGGSVCEDAANVMMQGMQEACQQYTDCCYCTCMAENKVPDPQATECTCIDDPSGGGTSGVDCAGDAKATAEACLADRDNCKAQGASLIDTMCALP